MSAFTLSHVEALNLLPDRPGSGSTERTAGKQVSTPRRFAIPMDLKVPIALLAHLGINGTPYVLESLTLVGEITGKLVASFLAGKVWLAIERIDVEWCKDPLGLGVDYPCGSKYSEVYTYQIARWDGIPLKQDLFKLFLGQHTWKWGQ